MLKNTKGMAMLIVLSLVLMLLIFHISSAVHAKKSGIKQKLRKCLTQLKIN